MSERPYQGHDNKTEPMTFESLPWAVKAFIHAKLGVFDYALMPLTGGRNNQTWRLVWSAENATGNQQQQSTVLKCFDVRPSDDSETQALLGVRAKLIREIAFYEYLDALKRTSSTSKQSEDNVAPTARLLAASESVGVILLSELQGQGVTQATVNHVDAMLNWIESINQSADDYRDILPDAADAHYGIRDVWDDIQRRLSRKHQLLLPSTPQVQSVNQSCYVFLNKYLLPRCLAFKWKHDALIEQFRFDAEVLSPSDFGLHNALEYRDEDDTSHLQFFDFEYAGKDSAWKLLADMFAQPRIPLPIAGMSSIQSRPLFATILQDIDAFLVYFELTLLKWVLIQLNPFFTAGSQRRRFAGEQAHDDTLRSIQNAEQLQKTTAYFHHIPGKVAQVSELLSTLVATPSAADETTRAHSQADTQTDTSAKVVQLTGKHIHSATECRNCQMPVHVQPLDIAHTTTPKHPAFVATSIRVPCAVSSDCRPQALSFELFRCPSCGQIQKRVDAEYQANIQTIYQQYAAYALTDGEEQALYSMNVPQSRCEQILSNIHEPLLTLQEAAMVRSGTVEALDIGTGSGVMLKALQQRFPQWRLSAHDVSAHQRDALNDAFQLDDFFVGDLKQALANPKNHGRFQFISLVHVLEHIEDPHHVLAQLKLLLAPDGILLIQVPNIEQNYWDFCIYDHVFHFDVPRLMLLLERHVAHAHLPDAQIVKEITLLAGHHGHELENHLYAQQEAPCCHVGLSQSMHDYLHALDELHTQLLAYPINAVLGTGPSAGFTCALGGYLHENAQTTHNPVTMCVDEDARKWHKTFAGYPVEPTSALSADTHLLLPYPPEQQAAIKARLVASKSSTPD